MSMHDVFVYCDKPSPAHISFRNSKTSELTSANILLPEARHEQPKCFRDSRLIFTSNSQHGKCENQ